MYVCILIILFYKKNHLTYNLSVYIYDWLDTDISLVYKGHLIMYEAEFEANFET